MTFGVRMRAPGEDGRFTRATQKIPRGPHTLYRKLQSLKFLLTRDREAVLRFLAASYPLPLPRRARVALIRDFLRVTHAMRGYHTLDEMLRVTDAIFARADGRRLVVVECGAGSGSSTAKLSLVLRHVGGRLLVYDSFQGIPENDEQHHLLDGRPLQFRKGAFKGRLSAVERRVAEYGAPEVCTFTKGLFEETLPGFQETVDVVLLDVDLVRSTRACTTALFPRLSPDGVLFSQDGHLRATVELYSDVEYWRREVGVSPPRALGLGEEKMLEIHRV